MSLLLCLALAPSICCAPSGADRAQAASPPKLIPRALLLGAPSRSAVRISSDGGFVGWLAEYEGRTQLHIAPVADPGRPAVVTEGERDVLDWRFAHTDQHLLYTRAVDDGDDVHLFVLDRDGKGVQDVTTDALGQTRIVGMNWIWKHHVALEVGGEAGRGLWLLDFIERNTHRMCDAGFEHYVFDSNMWPAGASGSRDGEGVIARMQQSKEWLIIDRFPAHGTRQAGVVSGGFFGNLYFVDDQGEDGTALKVFDVDSEEVRVLAQLEGQHLSPEGAYTLPLRLGGSERGGGEPRALLSSTLPRQRLVLEHGPRAEFDHLDSSLGCAPAFVGRDREDRVWLLRAERGGPASYHLFEREGRGLRRLFSDTPALDDHPMVQPSPVAIDTEDGLTLHATLYLPPGADEDGDGRPEAPLPTVVHLGDALGRGPAGAHWVSERACQLLADRGHAVLHAELRGGPGRAAHSLERASDEVGDALVDNALDIARWSLATGVAAEGHLALVGRALGGYIALRAAQRAPETFAAVVAIDAPTDLLRLLDASEGGPAWPWWRQQLGAAETKEQRERLDHHAVISAAAQLVAPLLLVHSGADAPFAPEHLADLAAAMGSDRQVSLARCRPTDGPWTAVWGLVEGFLALHTGAQSQPLGADAAALEFIVGARPRAGDGQE